MSGETRQSVSGWTIDTLKEYLESQLRSSAQLLSESISHAKETASAASKSAQLAIDKAESATAAKFASVNEFRDALSDSQERNIARSEADTRFSAIQDTIAALAITGVARGDALSARVDELNRRLLLREGAESGVGKTKDDSRVLNTSIIGWVVAIAIAAAAYVTK